MTDTGFLPRADLVPRIAATEDESYVGRGMLRGDVHDENAWSLGGAVGHAGVFGTAADLARLGEMIRLGGELDGVRVLHEATVAAMCTDQLPAHLDPGFRQGLGVRIDDPTSMGALRGPGTVGHTGFTGTSLVIDRKGGRTVVLLTNRVHPSRTWSDVGHVRRALAEAVVRQRTVARGSGRRRPVRHETSPRKRPDSWYASGRSCPRCGRRSCGSRSPSSPTRRAPRGRPSARSRNAVRRRPRPCSGSAAPWASRPTRHCAWSWHARPVANSNGPTAPSPTGDISPTDSVPQIVAKIAWSDARAIEDTAALLDVDSLSGAIDAVAGAERIDIYGVGASGFVAS